MKLSEFWRAISEEFGEAYGRTVAQDMVLGALGGRTAFQALQAGVDAREVWLALCDAMDVPPTRRYGAGRPEPKKD
jgi:hypothetical protein